MFKIFKPKVQPYFNAEQQLAITTAIKEAEHATSGEVRVYVESKCKFVNPLLRAKEVFYKLQMQETKNRNGVLIYLAFKDKQFAIFGDAAIYTHMGEHAFQKAAIELRNSLKNNLVVEGLCNTITHMGLELKAYFPNSEINKNELPDDIVFGK